MVRKKWILLTPEEWVRQHMIRYLHEIKEFPLSLMAVEKQLKVLGLSKRFDIMCAKRNGSPLLLIECKAPDVETNGAVFDQAARYNIALNAPFLCISNGKSHFFCRVLADRRFEWYNEIPAYASLQQPI